MASHDVIPTNHRHPDDSQDLPTVVILTYHLSSCRRQDLHCLVLDPDCRQDDTVVKMTRWGQVSNRLRT